jgi:hypothetical protein
VKTAIAPHARPDGNERKQWPPLLPDQRDGAREALDARSFDPTQGTKLGSEPYDDPTQGRQIGSDPYDDPTRVR